MHRRIVTVVALCAIALVLGGAFPASSQEDPPQTQFEQTNGESWTGHEEELGFLEQVDAASARVRIDTIGRTAQERPLQLVQIGFPQPRAVENALREPVILFVCTQHGNEPAGREACLKLVRDLAYTTDPVLLEQISSMTILVVPTANPDGREANSRGNSSGTDINRDHLNLETPEAQALAAVVRDWEPEMVLDLHEYGPSIPVLYDDDVLYLWPRNLNVEKQVHDLAQGFSLEHLAPCVEDAGYTSDEYGLLAAGPVDVAQTAGDGDEGIARNAMGLRHTLGILVETAVTVSTNPQQLPNEAADPAAQRRRRVASHNRVVDCTLEYFREAAGQVVSATSTAPLRKTGEGMAQNVPVYFGGADNDAPTAEETLYPAPCAYRLSPEQAVEMAAAFELHDVRTVAGDDGTVLVPLGQPAEPIIPLLLDERGNRHSLAAAPVDGAPLSPACGAAGGEDSAGTAAATTVGVLLVGALVRRRLGIRSPSSL